jgi:phage head maturation protease
MATYAKHLPVPPTIKARWEAQQIYNGPYPWPEILEEPADVRAEREERERRSRDYGGWRWFPDGTVRPVRKAEPTKPAPFVSEKWRAEAEAKWGKSLVDECLHRAGAFKDDAVNQRNRDLVIEEEVDHAIVADEVGLPVREIAATLDKSGYCNADLSALRFDGPDAREKLLRLSAFYLAGIAGQELRHGTVQPAFDHQLDQQNAEKFIDVWFHNDPAGKTKFHAEARALARRILTERANDVARVATALRERGRLDAAEFRKLVPAKQVRRVSLPLQTRSGAASYDAAAGTIQVIWATGARVKRSSYNGTYWEDLPPENADLTWLNSGKAPLLDSHNHGRVSDVLGIVQAGSAFVRDGKGYATIKLSSHAPIADIRNGTLKNISIGYSVDRVRQLPAGDDDIPVLLIESYAIKECSIVGVPADQGAEIRKYTCEWVTA